jgi:hypothetical protein
MAAHIKDIVDILRLTPYQSYILSENSGIYDMYGIVKRGGVIWIPRKCRLSKDFIDHIGKVFRGPRADLIGPDRVLVYNQRGIKLYPSGIFKAYDELGHHYYADHLGHRLSRSEFNSLY